MQYNNDLQGNVTWPIDRLPSHLMPSVLDASCSFTAAAKTAN